jgi:photosynthetic reaction center cytochrome c subunit
MNSRLVQSVTPAGVALVIGAALLLTGCERPPIQTQQTGYRGTAIVQVTNPRTEAKKAAANVVPEALPAADGSGPLAKDTYQNVKVLGDLSVAQFTRVMTAMTQWVSPQQGCAYCHNLQNLADDGVYAKVVARRMLQMTKHINADWKSHVADTGVTCYTCHRGQPVPANLWFANPPAKVMPVGLGNRMGQNAPSESVGLSSLPADPYSEFLKEEKEIRVHGTTALPTGNRKSIKQTEYTYALMFNFSDGLGVNCTYCHNSRIFQNWEQSSPARVKAWHAIRMVRNLNNEYLEPLGPTYPPERLGPTGDAPKAVCSTCHQGVPKPLYGVSMLKDYPELAK